MVLHQASGDATLSALNAGGLRHQIKGTWGMTAEGVVKSQTRCDKLRPTTQWCCVPAFQPGSGDCDRHIGEDLIVSVYPV